MILMAWPARKAVASAIAAGGLKKAARNLRPDVLAAAKKHGRAKGIPLEDVLATILLESRGNPKAHLKNSKEDSRGAMQVNINAWGGLLKSKGYTPNDLFDVEKGIDVGTTILGNFRKKVEAEISRSAVPLHKQAYDLGTITRMWYAGPKYTQDTIRKARTTDDTRHFFKNSEKYVANWQSAIQAVRAAEVA